MSTGNTDRIERQIEIAAPADRVWTLVSEPGWWINDGSVVPHRIEDGPDGEVTVHDDTHGAFRLRIERLDPPRYAAFRWIGKVGEPSTNTLTEFWVDETSGGVVVRVLESGLDGIAADKRDAYLRDNTAGWEAELAALRTVAESQSAA